MRNEDKGGEYEQMILSMSDDVEYIYCSGLWGEGLREECMRAWCECGCGL